jgi:plasmid stabilization system protein ParE
MAKRKIVWSRRAQIKLSDILEFYTERNGSKAYSVKLYAQISKAVKLLEKQPDIGHKSDFESIRGLIIKSYIIFYENFPDKILIHTIWDCKQNPNDNKLK